MALENWTIRVGNASAAPPVISVGTDRSGSGWKPRVSFIITSRHGDYLPEAVASIRRLIAHSGVSSEILIYDDASGTAESRERLERLQAESPELLQVFYGETPVGAALGRNAAIRHARADYLLIFDDDDLILPFDLKVSLDCLDQHPEIPLSYAPKYLFSAEKGFLNEIHGIRHSLIEAFCFPKVNVNAAIIRKTALVKAGGFRLINGDPKISGEDIDLIIRLGLSGPLHFEPAPRCLYRIHPRQLTAARPAIPAEVIGAPAREHPDLYRRIVQGEIPDVHGPDFRLVRGLMGAAFYFNQRDRKITDPVVRTALAEFPEDFGGWDVLLMTLTLDGRKDELFRLYPEVLERFQDEPGVASHLCHCLPFFAAHTGFPVPQDLLQKAAAIEARHLQIPPIVAAELQRIRQER